MGWRGCACICQEAVEGHGCQHALMGEIRDAHKRCERMAGLPMITPAALIWRLVSRVLFRLTVYNSKRHSGVRLSYDTQRGRIHANIQRIPC